MKRRQFLALSTATAAATLVGVAHAEPVEFSNDAYQAALDSGQPFILDFYAPW